MDAGPSGSESEEANQLGILNSIPVGLDFIKFFVTVGASAAALAGYSYTNEYFHHFGISLFDLDISYLNIVASAGYLLQDNWVLFGSIVVAILISLVVAVSRYFLGNLGFYGTATLLFLLLCYFAVQLGNTKAAEHSESIIDGTSGRLAYCVLRDEIEGLNNGSFTKEFKESFNKVTKDDRMVKILETRESIYLFAVPLPEKELPENYNGDSINIQKADLLYCRVMGTAEAQNSELKSNKSAELSNSCYPVVNLDCKGGNIKDRPINQPFNVLYEQ